ncbi:MAG: discoidin domain-containing protein [Parafilimonas sp.]
MSAIPNYSRSAPATDTTSLTDGVYTSGNFWTKTTTVGWLRRQVAITIDLNKIQGIGSISFNTARNTKVGVDFPKDVFAFVSNDGESFKYIGDIANTTDNTTGSYEVKKFVLGKVNTSARYVTLIVVPKGKLVFCDEIEILAGQKNAVLSSPSVSKSNLTNFADSLLQLDFQKNNINKLAENISGAVVNTSDADVKSIKDNLFQNHATKLNFQFKTNFIVEAFNPWDSLNELHDPIKASDSLNYAFTILQNGVQYGAFVITNSSLSSLKFDIETNNQAGATAAIEIFNVPFVPGADYSYVADPLIPADKEDINAGVSKLFLFKVSGKSAGSANASVFVKSGNKKIILNIKTDVLNLSAPDNYFVNANIWAYLNYPMLADRRAEAAKDLALHHIKTVVIPPSVVPGMQSDSYTKLLDYLSNFKGVNKILLFTKYVSVANRNGYNGGEFMTTDWKKNFIQWYNNLLQVLAKNGYENADIYLYPYDEVRGGDIKDFVALLQWAKKTIPGIKFYASLTNKEAVDNILPLVDVAQLQERPNYLNNLPAHTCELWTYHNASPARSLSPYTFYRLMAWQAFENDITGIGFWSYADEGKNKTLNLISDNLNDPASSYSAIYDGPNNSIISSRRWEAFSLGIEDYAILKLYSKKFGIQKAKDIANSVLSNPTDLYKADAARNSMLKNL